MEEKGGASDCTKRFKTDPEEIIKKGSSLEEELAEGNYNAKGIQEPCEEGKDCTSQATVPLTDVLFEKTLQYIHTLTCEDEAVKEVLRTMIDKKSFVRVINKKSKLLDSTDEFFWKTSKLITVGAAHSIELGNTKGNITKMQLTPVQFGGLKGGVPSGCSSYYQNLGWYGETWVGNQLKLNNSPYEAPGKICKGAFPLSSSTPDFIFMTGLNDCPEDAPIQFEQGAIIGVGEVKTSSLKLAQNPVWKQKDVTVKEIMSQKPTNIKNQLRWKQGKNAVNPRLPVRLRDHYDLCMRIQRHAEDSTRWSMWYYEDPEDESVNRIEVDFDHRNPNNHASIKLLSSSTGKQMLCEALSVLDYVDKDAEEVEIRAYFPSVFDKTPPKPPTTRANKYTYTWDDSEAEEEDEGGDECDEKKESDRPYFLTAFSLNCVMKVPIPDLREFDRVVNQHLAEAMYSVARSRFIL